MIRKTRKNKEKLDKWVPLCCAVVVEHAIVIDVFYFNSMISLTYENDSEFRQTIILVYL